ncbi:hypothetical protein F4801DRAFT_541570 [Xylaria longipes]|nr:hypothetical protein F4801DRAFT_541570 [Xylaria longipes]
MVVSTAQQLEDSYQLWQRFSFSTDSRSWDAVAVPSWVGDRLNAAFAIIIPLALVRFWTVILSLILYYSLKKQPDPKPDPLAATLWNKRADLVDSVIETIAFKETDWSRPWVLISVFLALAAWAAQTATGVLVPPLIILDHAAPVRPGAIYAPDPTPTDNSIQAARFALEVPRFLRALGSAVVDKDLRQKVQVSSAEPLGQTQNGEILQIDYSYGATGADLGIQKYFDLTLNVTGSCVTEYTWFIGTQVTEFNNNSIAIDYYDTPFNNPNNLLSASLLDGREPSATFYVNPNSTKGALDGSNSTWGAIVSSVNRTSFSIGTDPWYLTDPSSGTTGTQSVRRGRPAISCWEDKIWSYHGHTSTTDVLTGDALPGLNLSKSLQGLLAQYLGVPTVFLVGSHLQTSALLSSTTALDQIFDAGASSLHDDLERLVVAAYVVTVNCLTDTTLYPAAQGNVPNVVLGDSGQVPKDAADFVVWSSDVATLSTVVIIVIPTIFVGIWFFSILLLYWTPVKTVVEKLDSSALQDHLNEDRPSATTPGDIEKAGEPETKSEPAPKPTLG